MTQALVTARGFAEPVFDSQRTFRALLEAIARPGTIVTLADLVEPPAPLTPGAAALCLTLLDYDTPTWLAPEMATPAAVDYLRFHCGCPISADPAAARFALGGEAMVPLADLPRGTPDYPDRSATLIQQVSELRSPGAVSLSGPGVDGETSIDVTGLSGSFWPERNAVCAAFPCGIDVILTTGDRLMAVPRSTTVELP